MECPSGFTFVIEHKTGNYYKTTGQEQMIPKGQGIVDDMELMIALSANPHIRMCRKAITPGKTSVEMYKADLYTEEEKAELAEKGGKKDVDAPWMEFLGHGYAGHKISEVVILGARGCCEVEEMIKTKWRGWKSSFVARNVATCAAQAVSALRIHVRGSRDVEQDELWTAELYSHYKAVQCTYSQKSKTQAPQNP